MDGNFYGTTDRGGAYGYGTIYRLTPDGEEIVLHDFNVRVDGDYPSALIEGADGNFYGTAQQNVAGPGPFGFLFRMAPDGTFTTLHAFSCGADGAYPADALVQANDGNFYGTTVGIADPYCAARATVFRMTPDGTVSIVHVFSASTEGTQLAGPLIQARDGNVYGTASAGGPLGGGTVFRVTLEGALTVLHAFRAPDDADGNGPRGALVEAADDSLYGVTSDSGLCRSCGTVFRISVDGTFDVAYAFQDDFETGIFPQTGLTRGADGNLYGVTAVRPGAVFQLTPDGDLSVLHAFNRDTDGSAAQARLFQASDDRLYGTARDFGPASTGTVFRVTTDGDFDVIYTFPGSAEGASPSVLVQANDGTLYGIAQEGGTFNRGTVFRLEPDGTPTTLYTFQGSWDGADPVMLIQADDGNLYGLAARGGDSGFGTFFQLTPEGAFAVLYAFTGDSSILNAGSSGLLQGRDGAIYGVTATDGAYNRGAVFRWIPEEDFTILYSFDGSTGSTEPITLMQASDGSFYGTTYFGGPNNRGTVFHLALDGTVTTLVDDLGCYAGPVSIIQATDGNIYLDRCNDIIRMTPDGAVTLVHSFGFMDGSPPQGFVQAADGNLYGVARLVGGQGLRGTVFRLTLNGTFTVLHTFADPDGVEPSAAPIQASDGLLYGTTYDGGGPGKQGVVWRLALDNESGAKIAAASMGNGQRVKMGRSASSPKKRRSVLF
jgi:uncharacterized repeat protein (TIGR03803 family)